MRFVPLDRRSRRTLRCPMLRLMSKLAREAALILGLAGPLFLPQSRAFAQSAPPSSTASFPPPPEATASPTPSSLTPAPAPVAAPAPLPTPPNAPPAAGPPPSPPGPSYPEPQPYGQGYPPDPNAPQREPYPGGDPPPPPRNPDEGFKIPDMSVRIDPFNFLLEGRLGLELETQLYQFLTLEIVPVFVTTKSPPTLNYNTYEKASLRQESNGLGAISGAAIDAGFWFGGKPFNGYVFRTGFTNYAYKYTTTDPGNDSVSHTDRQFFAMVGSHNRWGAFTIAGGIGLAYELNKQNRCFDSLGSATSSCDKDELLIKLNQDGSSVADLHSFLYPFDLLARFSLGVVF